MEVPDCGQPQKLTTVNQVPEVGPHVTSDGVRLQFHDSHVPCDKCHGRHRLVRRWLPFRGVDILMGANDGVNDCLLADLSLPELCEPPLGATILVSSSPPIPSSIKTGAGTCAVLSQCSTMHGPDLLRHVEVDGGTRGDSGVVPSPCPSLG